MATSSEDAKARVGVTLLATLTDSPLATRDELEALSNVTNDIMDAYLAPLQEMEDDEHGDAAANRDPGQEVARDDGSDTADRDNGRSAAHED